MNVAGLLVIVALFAVVDIATKAMAGLLSLTRRAPAIAAFAALVLAVGIGRFLGWLPDMTVATDGAAPLLAMAAFTESPHTGHFLLNEIGKETGKWSREQVTLLHGQDLLDAAVLGLVKVGVGRASVPTVVGTGTGTMTLVTAGPEVEVGNYVVKCITAVTNGGVFSVTAPSGLRLPNFTMTPGSGGTTAYTSSHINFSVTDNGDFAADDVFTIIVGTTAPVVVGSGSGTIGSISLGPEAQPGNYKLTCTVVATNLGTFSVVAPDGDALADATVGTAFVSKQINFTIADGGTDYAAGDVFNIAVFNQLTAKAVAWDPTAADGREDVAGVLYGDSDATDADVETVMVARGAEVIAAELVYGAAITAQQKADAVKQLKALGIVAR